MINEDLPITMGNKLIGRISIDSDSGKFSGIFDIDLVDLLKDSFQNNLMDISFFGKLDPFIDPEEYKLKWKKYLDREDSQKESMMSAHPYGILSNKSNSGTVYYSIIKQNFSNSTMDAEVYIADVGSDLKEAIRITNLLNKENARLKEFVNEFDRLVEDS